jgi:methylmalonyl-CoA mutase
MSKSESLNAGFNSASREDWIEKAKKNAGEDELKKLLHTTAEGILLSAYYDSNDVSPETTPTPQPGVYPFTGGFREQNHVSIRQRITIDKIMKTNEFILEAIDNGANSIELSGDDIGTENETNRLFKGISFQHTPFYFQLGESGTAFAYILLDYLERSGAPTESCHGGILNDPLGLLSLRGNFDYPEKDTYRTLQHILNGPGSQLPNYRMIWADGSLYANAGASASAELGFTASKITEYLDKLTDLGMSPDSVVKSMEITLSTSQDYLLTIAKIRAFRQIWSQIAAGFNIKTQPTINIVCQERYLSVYDTHNNIIRATLDSMAAYAAGCDSLTVLPFDATYKNPDAFSYRMARNIALILKHEAHFQTVTDPAAGSYYLETLTAKLTETGWEYFTECEKNGGFTASLRKKYIQGIIEKQSSEELKKFTEGKISLVGTNRYVNKEEEMSPYFEKVENRELPADTLEVIPIRPYRLSEKMDVARLTLEKKSSSEHNIEDEMNEEEL